MSGVLAVVVLVGSVIAGTTFGHHLLIRDLEARLVVVEEPVTVRALVVLPLNPEAAVRYERDFPEDRGGSGVFPECSDVLDPGRPYVRSLVSSGDPSVPIACFGELVVR